MPQSCGVRDDGSPASALIATGGATLERETNTGAATNDLKAAVLREVVASAGANAIGASWTGSADTVLVAVNIPEA